MKNQKTDPHKAKLLVTGPDDQDYLVVIDFKKMESEIFDPVMTEKLIAEMQGQRLEELDWN